MISVPLRGNPSFAFAPHTRTSRLLPYRWWPHGPLFLPPPPSPRRRRIPSYSPPLDPVTASPICPADELTTPRVARCCVIVPLLPSCRVHPSGLPAAVTSIGVIVRTTSKRQCLVEAAPQQLPNARHISTYSSLMLLLILGMSTVVDFHIRQRFDEPLFVPTYLTAR